MKKRFIWIAVVALYVLFIFSNSMKPAELSSEDSGAVLRLVHQVLAWIGADKSVITEHMIRKTAHFSEYTLLGILLFQCLKLCLKQLDKRIFFQIIIGFMVSFVDETIQLFVEGRSGQISDVWLDCFGVVCGTLLSAALIRIAGKAEKRKYDKKLQNDSSI